MKALYAGSFDPITNGHIDIIRQALAVFDHVIIGVAVNPDKKYLFSVLERVRMVREAICAKDLQGDYTVFAYEGLTVECAKKVGASILVRGLRAVSDFDIEFQMVQFNRQISPGCNTMFFMPDETNFYLSSTAIRGIASMGGAVFAFVPECVADAFAKK
jgi:pantetheine-phosphate adenylyltransferase